MLISFISFCFTKQANNKNQEYFDVTDNFNNIVDNFQEFNEEELDISPSAFNFNINVSNQIYLDGLNSLEENIVNSTNESHFMVQNINECSTTDQISCDITKTSDIYPKAKRKILNFVFLIMLGIFIIFLFSYRFYTFVFCCFCLNNLFNFL